MGDAGWPLSIKDMSWVEKTTEETDFIIESLSLKGNERILDIACGFGRHSLELARRGFSVVGTDYTGAFIDDAVSAARSEGLEVEFYHSDALELTYSEEFDVVLNMADGAIGYFHSEEENLKLFDVISGSLRSGGRHVMGLCSAEFFSRHCPWRTWQAGTKTLSVSDFLWNGETSRLLYRGHQIRFGEPVKAFADEFPPDEGMPGIRLYTIAELASILGSRGMRVIGTYGAYDVNIPASAERRYMSVVCSEKL